MTPPAPPSPLALHWARLLDPCGQGVAFVLHPQQVFVAPNVLDLVEGIWHLHPQQAHRLLRSRVFTTHAQSDLDRAIVHLCGRKLCPDVPTHGQGARDDGTPRSVHDLTEAASLSRRHHLLRSAVDAPAVDSPIADWLHALVPTAEGARATRARPVVAALLDADGTVLDVARNTHGTHRLHHAEVNLVQRWRAHHGRTLPDGSQVLVSLQCCRMCAALLVDAAPPGGLRVRYLEPETGRFGRHTALQARDWEAPLDQIASQSTTSTS